jgi:hypothetical protein
MPETKEIDEKVKRAVDRWMDYLIEETGITVSDFDKIKQFLTEELLKELDNK